MTGEEGETADIDWIRKNLGFVADHHRICVGITRSKFGLVIVGELTRMTFRLGSHMCKYTNERFVSVKLCNVHQYHQKAAY